MVGKMGLRSGRGPASADAPSTPGIALNEDNSHFFYTRMGWPVTESTVDEWVDQYAGTQVRELVMCVNCMRTGHDSAVWEPIWSGYDPDGPDDQPLLASLSPAHRRHARRWVHTAWAFHAAGIDTYARRISRARAKGLSPWLSMRMNDVHNADDEACHIHSRFWRARPDLRRVGYRSDRWTDRAFDYGQPEVRAYHLSLVEELAGRYDFDGLELDWMRFGFHFRPGFEQEGLPILTEFTREVRRILDGAERRRGHRIRLGARVPTRPATALGLGMDAVGWAREGLLDMLVVTPFWASCETDMPIEIWKQLLSGTGTVLAAGLEAIVRPDPEMKPVFNSIETVRGMASSLLARGADRIYLFNYMDWENAMSESATYPRLLREAGSLETMAGKPRRHVVTFSDTWAPGEPEGRLLPAPMNPGEWKEFRIHVGPRPECRSWIGLCADAPFSAEALEVRLNGAPCGPCVMTEFAKPRAELPSYAWEIPEEALKGGFNLVEIRSDMENRLRWVEIGVGPAKGSLKPRL